MNVPNNYEVDYTDYYEMVEKCPEDGSDMVEQREDRGNGLIEYVLYCPICGLTMTWKEVI